MQNCNKKKLLIVTNHSYMLYRFRKELIQRLMEEYEVMEEVCEKEVLAFLDKLEQAGILEEV